MLEAEKRADSHPKNTETNKPSICDVSLYFDLYEKVLVKSGGDLAQARKDTLEAASNDGVSLIQENISTLIEDMDPLLRVAFQLTPTENIYLENIDEHGNKIISSPEHEYLRKSIKEGVTSWRRGNDATAISFVEDLFYQMNEGESAGWSSPKAEDWEEPLVREFNGEYGYFYKGKIIKEGDQRKMVLHSYKLDSSTQVYQALFTLIGGEVRQAPSEPNPDWVYKDPIEDLSGSKDPILEPQRPFLDTLMRSVLITKEELDNEAVWQKIYQAKKAAGEEEKNFNLSLDALLFAQDESLRDRIKKEVAIPIAEWLVGEIEKGAPPSAVQSKIKDKYIQKTKQLISKLEAGKEEQDKVMAESNRGVSKGNLRRSLKIEAELKDYKESSGKFCGGWGSTNINSRFALARAVGGGGAIRTESSIGSKLCPTCLDELCLPYCLKCDKGGSESSN